MGHYSVFHLSIQKATVIHTSNSILHKQKRHFEILEMSQTGRRVGFTQNCKLRLFSIILLDIISVFKWCLK